MKVSEGDKFELDSINGHHYTIEIVNVNQWRPPQMIYACDIWMDNDPKASYFLENGDYYFCGDEILLQCKKVGEEKC